MFLASADTTMDLKKLADMSDKVIEVSTKMVISISVPESKQQTSYLETKQLREDITRLTEHIECCPSVETIFAHKFPSQVPYQIWQGSSEMQGAAVNDTPIRMYGNKSLTLNLGLRRAVLWIFIAADVQQPIVSAEFLRHFEFLVDMKLCQLRDTLKFRVSCPRHPLLVTPLSPKMPITNISLFSRNFVYSPRCLHHGHLSREALCAVIERD